MIDPALVHQHLPSRSSACGEPLVMRMLSGLDFHAVAAQVAVGDVLAQRGEPSGSGVLQRH